MINHDGWTSYDEASPKCGQCVMVRYWVRHPNGVEAQRFEIDRYGTNGPNIFYDDDGYTEMPTHWTRYELFP